jgi:hypothetical protein
MVVDLLAVHDRLPPGVAPADNQTGWRESLAKLAALLETVAFAIDSLRSPTGVTLGAVSRFRPHLM